MGAAAGGATAVGRSEAGAAAGTVVGDGLGSVGHEDQSGESALR